MDLLILKKMYLLLGCNSNLARCPVFLFLLNLVLIVLHSHPGPGASPELTYLGCAALGLI